MDTALATGTFHEGEIALQKRAGSYDKLAQIASRVIRDHMPEQHRQFFAQLPFVVAGSVDAQGQPWASVLARPQGFISSPDPQQLQVKAWPQPHDPLAQALIEGAPIGLLGIEPHTRRRNRMNGTVASVADGTFTVQVGPSFGNCPQYIQAREPQFVAARHGPVLHESGALDEAARALIARADTFYIATAHPQALHAGGPAHGVDVSHRGGKPGFVRIDGEGSLTVPDFLGNYFFNTLGNIALNPRCGLLFIDFESGELLYVAARARITWDGPEVEAFEGAQRLLHFAVTSVRRVEGALPLRWGEAEMAPQLARTGHW